MKRPWPTPISWRWLICTVAITAVAASSTAAASEPDPAPGRQASRHYNALSLEADPLGARARVGAVRFATLPAEKTAEVAVRDAANLPVGVWIGQDLDGDSRTDVREQFCPIQRPPQVEITGGAVLHIALIHGSCSSGATSIPTTGEINVTFRD